MKLENVTVWSKDACVYCDRAKTLLTASGIPYTEKKIGHGFTGDEMRLDVPGARSVPQIIADGHIIGGYQNLVARLAE